MTNFKIAKQKIDESFQNFFAFLVQSIHPSILLCFASRSLLGSPYAHFFRWRATRGFIVLPRRRHFATPPASLRLRRPLRVHWEGHGREGTLLLVCLSKPRQHRLVAPGLSGTPKLRSSCLFFVRFSLNPTRTRTEHREVCRVESRLSRSRCRPSRGLAMQAHTLVLSRASPSTPSGPLSSSRELALLV